MSILFLLGFVCLLALVFAALYFSNSLFRKQVEAPKYQALAQEQRFAGWLSGD